MTRLADIFFSRMRRRPPRRAGRPVGRRADRTAGRRLVVEPLEPRLLLSADGVLGAVDVLVPHVEGSVTVANALPPASVSQGSGTWLTANPLGDVAVNGLILSSTQVDIYAFMPEVTGSYVITTGANMDTQIRVYNSVGSAVTPTINAVVGGETTTQTLTAGSWAYVAVSAPQNNSGGYSFAIDGPGIPATAIATPGPAFTGSAADAVNPGGDLDYFTVTAPGGVAGLDLTVTPAAGLDTFVEVYSSAGVLVASVNTGGAGAADTATAISVLPGATYSIGVAASKFGLNDGRTQTGSYTLAVDFNPGPPASVTPGSGTWLRQNPIGQVTTGGSVASDTEVDLYAFMPEVTGSYGFTTGGLLDTQIRLYDASGSAITGIINANPVWENTSRTLTAGSWYYAAVTSAGGFIGDYTIAVGGPAAPTTTVTAPPGPAFTSSFFGTVNSGGDIDYFQVNAPSGTTSLDVTVTPAPGLDTFVEVFEHGTNTRLRSFSTGGAGSADVATGITGGSSAYYIGVSGAGRTETGNYTIGVDFNPDVAPASVTPGSGAWLRLTPQGRITTNGVISALNEVDVYAFMPDVAGVYTITTSGAAVDSVLRVFDQNGAPITDVVNVRVGSTLGESVAPALAADAWYYVSVTGYQGSTGGYLFTITGPTPALTPVATPPLEFFGTVTGTIDQGGDSDYVPITTPVGTSQLRVDLRPGAGLDAVVQIYDGDTVFHTMNAGGPGGAESGTVLVAGRAGFRIAVGAADRTQVGSYVLDVYFTPELNDGHPPREILPNGGEWIWANPFGDVVTTDSIATATELDIYAFMPDMSGSFSFTTSGPLDAELRVYDASGTWITPILNAGGAGGNESTRLSLTGGSWYYVGVGGTGSLTGAYTLAINGPSFPLTAIATPEPRYTGSTSDFVDYGGDLDYVVVTAPAGAMGLTVKVRPETLWDPFVELYDAAGTWLRTIGAPGAGVVDGAVNIPITGGQTYYIGIGGTIRSANGRYTVSVDFNPDAVPSFMVSGTAAYSDRAYGRNGVTGARPALPIRSATVEVWEDNGAVDSLLGTTQTTSDGTWSFLVPDNDDPFGRDVYVRILADGDAAVVGNPADVTYALGGPTVSDWLGGDLWYDANPLDAIDQTLAPTTETLHAAFNTFDQIVAAREVLGTVGEDPGKVRIRYRSGGTEGAFYDAGVITLEGQAGDFDNGFDDSVIRHEYGHFVAERISHDRSPGGSHTWVSHVSDELAWSEGWATFFSSATMNQPFYVDVFFTAGFTQSDLLSVSLESPETHSLIGDDVEGAIALVLWDVFDAANEAHDTLALGLDEIVAVMSDPTYFSASTSCTLVDFYRGWQARGDGTLDALRAILADRGIVYWPTLGSLAPVSSGASLTLTANAVSATAGVASVTFYRESNGVTGLQAGAGGDTVLGTDANAAGGWSLSVSTAGLAGGTYTFYARATDALGDVSAPSATTHVVLAADDLPASVTPGTGTRILANPFGDQTRFGSIAVSGETDIWAFLAERTGSYTIDVEADALDSQLRVYGADGGAITGTIDAGGAASTETTTQTLTAGAWYYVAVGGRDTSTGTYVLGIEGLDVPQTSIPVPAPGHAGSASGVIESGGDLDYFVVTPPAGATTLRITVTPVAGLDTFVELYRFSGTSLQAPQTIGAGGPGSADVATDIAVGAGTTYYIGVSGMTRVETGGYTVAVDFDPDAPATTFRVIEVDPLPSGVRIRLSEAVDPSVLNLYDTQTGGLGPADVTLVGAARGPVRGSLVVENGNRDLVFVATGGVLAPDTYTVTVRSTANGIRATDDGALLDGDVDGTPGADHVAQFTVGPPPAMVLSLADFARGPGQDVNVPASVSGIAVHASSLAGVDSIDFRIVYDPTLLVITGVTRGAGLPGDAVVQVNLVTPGLAIVGVALPTPMTGAADVVILDAEVPATAPYRALQRVGLAQILINEGAISAIGDDAVHVAAFFGDTTGNGGYSSLDGQRALRVAVLLDSGFAAFPLVDPVVIADITGNGLISSLDGTRILQRVVSMPRPEFPALPDPMPALTFSAAAPAMMQATQSVTDAPSAPRLPLSVLDTGRVVADVGNGRPALLSRVTDRGTPARVSDPSWATTAPKMLGPFTLDPPIDHAASLALIDWTATA